MNNGILRRTGTDFTEPLRRFFEGDLDTWLRTEEYKENGTLVIKAEVPGIDPDKDVDITMTGDQLRITVRHEEKTEHTGKEGYRSEFRYGTFSRAVTVPAGADQTAIKATYIDGILEVRVPLPEQDPAERRKIPISRA
ncbi:Hsp20/alpha crystallin family protein [Pseudarthrobacter sp. NamE2]|uniref:Hsp20/alpha crystallin family protein n=1 Tax=Pseudarthrobacter sp. NamE2 TaxID=2576838 RepID=UPI0010FDFC36|nr:Hsp20/alpha crystallin family protein [Pseudarthrobacter sp. NamE2]TLM82637.1 Hsp20/alpha crystallin family protein [Pseudarthrobacter sp. NamE2]